jgi:septal ring factor EnvC (AmiA/AmiB activator)
MKTIQLYQRGRTPRVIEAKRSAMPEDTASMLPMAADTCFCGRGLPAVRSVTILLALLCLARAPWAAEPEASEPGAGSGSPVTAEMARHERELGELMGRLHELQQELTDREQHRDALYQDLERNERDIAALALAGRQLLAMVTEQRRAVADLGARQAKTARELAGARAELTKLLRSAYAMGRGDRLRMLLNREDLTRSGRVFGYYRCLGRERAARIAEVERLAAKLETLRAEAEAEAERLQRLAESQEQTRLRLESAQAERSTIVADLDASIAEDRDQLSALNQDAEALRSLIDRLRREAQIAAEIGLSQEDIESRQARLDWPIAEARLLSRFHRAEAATDLHADGVMIAADEGTEVHAVHNGRVVYADWLRGFGMLMVIDHGDGYMTLYGHNQTLLKEVGEWVGSGEVIALTGASGGSGGPGLYFAIRHDGEPLDPERWCRAEEDGELVAKP